MSTTIKKALTVIELLAEREQPWSLSELARQLNSPKSNVHFLLNALSSQGYVEQDPATRRYFLTLKLWELGTRVLGRLNLRRVASPYLAELAGSTSETVNLAILDHDEVIYVHKIDSPSPARAYTPEGRRAPAYCTSTGKAILAYQPHEAVKSVANNIKHHTERTVKGLRELQRELNQIRELGYAMNRGEWWDSVRGAAAPILNNDRRAIAAVGVFGPAERLPLKKLEQLAGKVRKTAMSISAALGYGHTD